MIRNFTQQDKDTVLAMVTDFYTSPGVLHQIPVSNFADAFDDMVAGTPHLRGLLIECDGEAAGYCQLTFSYSTEAGGLVVSVEELYITPAFRGRGLGHEAFDYIKKEYAGKAARIRLEVNPENPRAAALYARLGFEELPYTQMINEDF
ncbi:MAG: GNAT family N-acetyltransferase [Ruthenibacterium sp.]